MLSNSLGNGFRRSLATAAGDLSANIVQMIVAAVGLTSLIYTSREIFIYIKWAGVAYLVFIGVVLFRREMDPAVKTGSGGRSSKVLYWQGFMTSASNPKAIIFFAALFPLFVNPQAPAPEQFVILGLTFLVVDGSFLCAYGGFAGWIAQRFQQYVGHHMNRISGLLLMVAAILLGMRDIEIA
jgi:threonine/homoserine/homoserine lactone efflux protein